MLKKIIPNNFRFVKRSKNLSVLLVLLIPLIVIPLFLIIKNRNISTFECRSWMEQLDPKILSLETNFEKVSPKTESPIIGRFLKYTINYDSPAQKFILVDSENNESWVNIVVNSNSKPKSSINNDTIVWKNILPSIDLEQKKYKDALQNVFKLNKSSEIIEYQIEKSGKVYLQKISGGMIAVKSSATSEELLVFKSPQGIDSGNERIDFFMELEGDKIRLTPQRDWQLGCETSPITLYSQITSASLDEALVKVGDKCDTNNCLKDGDILQIKPAGWNWGLKERKVYAIIKIPKQTEENRREYSSRTTIPPDPEGYDKEITQEEALAALPENEKQKVFDIEGLARYAIDYTNLATPEQLENIHNPQQDSPILDATALSDFQNPIVKKPDPRISIIPLERRFTFAESQKLVERKTIRESLIPPVHAAGVVVKSIGTGVGRQYSTIADWETGESGDLVTAQEIRVGKLFKDSEFDLTAQILINGATTNSSYYMQLTVAESDRHTGIAGTGVVIDGQTESGAIGFSCFNIRDNYTVVEWIEAKRCRGSGSGASIQITDDGTNRTDGILIQNVIIHDFDDTGFTIRGIGWANITVGSQSNIIRNCIIYDGDRAGIQGDSANTDGVTATIENCSIDGSNIMLAGIYEDGNSCAAPADVAFTVRNTIVMNTTTEDYDDSTPAPDEWCGSREYSISEDASADDDGGTGNLVSKTYSGQFVNTSTGFENLHLKAGSDAIDNGTAGTNFAYDIDSEARPQLAAWDIGADEYSSDEAVAFWKFDEGTDNTCSSGINDVCDLSSNANNGAFSGGTAWKAEDMCVNGKCLFFDGSDDVVTVNNSNSLDFDLGLNNGVTFAVWIKVNSDGEANVGEIFDKGTNTYLRNTNQTADGFADLEAKLDLSTADATASVIKGITLNKWHHVAVGYTDDADDEITVYIDGRSRAVSTDGDGSPASTDTNNLLIGGDSGANFHGYMDMLKVYPYERTSDQVKTDLTILPSSRGSSAVFGRSENSEIMQGLVGYWKFDETSGNASDSSGFDTTLINNNTTTFTSAKYARGAEHNGTTQYFDAADNDYLSLTGSITLSAWIIPDVITGSHAIVGKFDDADESYLLFQTTDEIRMYIDSSSNYVTTNAANLAANSVYHVLGVYDSVTQTIRLYVNGIFQESTITGTIPSSIGDDAGEFSVGAEDTGGTPANYFDGHIDDVRVYNRALSPKEVQALYNFGPPPVAYWKMDEGSGIASILDSSGNGNTATLNGTMAPNDWVAGKYGNALDFDGSDDNASVASVLNLTNASVTIATWVYLYDTSEGGAFVKLGNEPSPNNGFGIGVGSSLYENEGNDFLMLFEGIRWIDTNTTIGTGWHHIAMTVDPIGVPEGFIDGKSVGRFTGTNATAPTGSTRVGGYSNGGINRFGNYRLDDTRIYNYARSASQIIEDMNAGNPVPGSFTGSATGYWKFDEGALNTCTGGTNDFCDSSNNGKNLAYSTTTGGFTNAGKFGKAFDGDGTRWASLADDTDFDYTATDNFSISMWIKSDSATNPSANEVLINKHVPINNIGYRIHFNTSGQIECGIDDDTTSFPEDSATSIKDYYDSTWHNLICVRNVTEDNMYLYVDGILVDDDGNLSVSATLATTDNLSIGDEDESDDGDEFFGDIDEVKIFRTALTSEQVIAEFNQGKSAVWGTTSTDSSGNASSSSQREYCPPGDTGGNCGGSNDPSPVGEWKFDENTGTTVYDTSGNGYNSTAFANNTARVIGKQGGALSFDGTDDVVEISDQDAFSITTTNQLTVEAWFKPAALSTSKKIISKNKTGQDEWILGMTDLNRVYAYIINTGASAYLYAESDSTFGYLETNKWYHLAFTVNISTNILNLYINSVLLGTDTTASGSLANGTAAVRFGEDGDGNGDTNGVIDDVRIYNYVRTPAQIARDHNGGTPTAWYKFDDCSGKTIHSSVPEINNNSSFLNLDGLISIGTSGDNTALGVCNSGISTEAWNNGTTGKFNNSLDFDGNDDFATVECCRQELDLNTGLANGFTISTWINADSAGETNVGRIFQKATGTYCRTDSPSGTNLHIECGLDLATTDATLDIIDAITTGTWNHIALSWTNDDDDEITIWVNGRNAGSSTDGSGAAAAESGSIFMGGTAANFDGKIDDFRVYPYEMTAQQIRTVYNEGSTVRFGPSTGSP